MRSVWRLYVYPWLTGVVMTASKLQADPARPACLVSMRHGLEDETLSPIISALRKANKIRTSLKLNTYVSSLISRSLLYPLTLCPDQHVPVKSLTNIFNPVELECSTIAIT
jgi:hypothetical protein